MKTVLLVFGNEYIEEDNLAVNISRELNLKNIDLKRENNTLKYTHLKLKKQTHECK